MDSPADLITCSTFMLVIPSCDSRAPGSTYTTLQRHALYQTWSSNQCSFGPRSFIVSRADRRSKIQPTIRITLRFLHCCCPVYPDNTLFLAARTAFPGHSWPPELCPPFLDVESPLAPPAVPQACEPALQHWARTGQVSCGVSHGHIHGVHFLVVRGGETTSCSAFGWCETTKIFIDVHLEWPA